MSRSEPSPSQEKSKPKKRALGPVTLSAITALAIGCLYVARLWSDWEHRAQYDAQRHVCKANLNLLEQGIRKYEDRNARFPDSLSLLVPEYIDAVPTCPVGSAPYEYSNEPTNRMVRRGTTFSLGCSVKEHVDLESYHGTKAPTGLRL